MNRINIIIDNFINKNKTFNIKKVKELVSQVLLNQNYDEKLYQQLVENNFELFKNELLEKMNDNNIDIDVLNKLLDESKKIKNISQINIFFNEGEDKIFTNIYKNISLLSHGPNKNIFIHKINYIWNNMKNKNNTINLTIDKINFIEKKFEGEYEDYLYFIIPRIVKLNKKQMNLLIIENNNIEDDNNDDDFLNNASFIDTSTDDNSVLSNNENVVINTSVDNISTDIEYIKVLELNINNLQTQVQNIYDTIIPKVLEIENNILKVNTNIENHQKYTINSIEILEKRLSKLMDVLNQTKI